jgi:hypothetical protein
VRSMRDVIQYRAESLGRDETRDGVGTAELVPFDYRSKKQAR